jgi:MarR family transcriptional regulator, organic hydroperoxide resistance regulator
MRKRDVIPKILDNVRRVFHILNEYSKKAERETGLTGPQLWTIKVMAENKPLRVLDLARLLYLHPSTVVGILDRLETRNLIERSRSKEDKRVVWVQLTDKGRELVESAPEVAQGLLVLGLEQLPWKTLIGINTSLTKLVEIFGVAEIPPRLILSAEVNMPQENEPRES